MKTKLKCKQCEKEFDYEYPLYVDVSENPKFKDEIMEGKAFVSKCPFCQMEQVVQYSLLYVDPNKKFAVALAPEPIYDIAREEKERPVEKIKEIMDSGEYQMRLVNNSNGLAEKIIIADSPFDDRIIEIIKVCYFHSISEELQKENTQLSDMLFGYEEGKGNFWLRLADGRSMTLDLDMDMYNEIEKDLGDKLEKFTPKEFCPINSQWAYKVMEAQSNK